MNKKYRKKKNLIDYYNVTILPKKAQDKKVDLVCHIEKSLLSKEELNKFKEWDICD